MKDWDWEDIFDTFKGMLGAIIFLSLLGVMAVITINGGQQIVPHNTNIEINSTNYTCIPTNIDNSWHWDFTFHTNMVGPYFLMWAALLFASLIIMAFMFGYIPICGCGGCP